jgi:hypothetical protein
MATVAAAGATWIAAARQGHRRGSSWIIFSEFKEFAGFFQQVFELFSITIDLFSEPGLTARLHSPIFHITIVVNALRRLCE